MKRIAVGLSGGVDSALAAALLKEQGYALAAFHFHLWAEKKCNRCCGDQLLRAAQQTAQKLGIPFYELDLKASFKQKVVDVFLSEYKRGRTPNPCILCNKFVRFGEALEIVKERFGCDFLATGHYARIIKDEESFHLLRGKDLSKDQSYFLYSLNQKQLSKIVFPLGELKKEKVWQMAKKRKLPAVQSQESFDVCFTHNLKQFLIKNLGKSFKPGEVIWQKQVIGQHQGLALYTRGSRGGWHWLSIPQKELSHKGQLPKLYVVKEEVKKNQLIVGTRKEASQKTFKVERVGLGSGDYLVKIRNTGKLLKCQLKINQVVLDKPEFGITPGQSAVFYQAFKDDFEVVGGGLING